MQHPADYTLPVEEKPAPRTKYFYLLSYVVTGSLYTITGYTRFGNVEIECPKPITQFDQMAKLQATVLARENALLGPAAEEGAMWKGCTIISFQLLREEKP